MNSRDLSSTDLQLLQVFRAYSHYLATYKDWAEKEIAKVKE